MASTAIVARTRPEGMEYLSSFNGPAAWDRRIQVAARFATVREATRTALRLPGRLRAYALPLGPNGAFA